MSYKVIVEIYCDHPGCEKLMRRWRDNTGGLSKTHAARMARHHGWWTEGGDHVAYADARRAYCPEHHPEDLR